MTFVGPGVKVTMMQYAKKADISIMHSLLLIVRLYPYEFLQDSTLLHMLFLQIIFLFYSFSYTAE
ncbi:MAG: hypothetical protein ACPKOI_04465 [Pleomorphochaeta sp.]